MAKENNETESKVAPTFVSILTKSPFDQFPAQGNLVQQHRKIETLPEDVRVSKASGHAGFMREVSPTQYFVTIQDTELAGFGYAGSCREFPSPRDDKESRPTGCIRGNTKLGPVLEVKVTNCLERYGIETGIDSMQNDGTQSWNVISRGIDQYVTELPEENKKPIHFEEVATNAEQPRRDETERTIFCVFIFIFVDYDADQSTDMGTIYPLLEN